MDFAALPPEVNSGRMYAGAGAGPLVAAAAAWDELASELSSAATSYQSVISGLTSGSWLGPTSATMAAAAAPYVGWINTTAAQAEQTASQARTAAAAYEAAFSATVPPPVIATNRSQLASLVATNILGQNTAAIAATESLYGEMWAQDAAAMYGYAGASASATQLTPFSAAPQTTNASGTATQAAAATAPATANAAATTVPSAAATASTNPLQALADLINDFNATPLGTGLSNLSYSVGLDNNFLSGFTFYSAAATFLVAPLHALALPNLGANGGLVAAASPLADVPAATSGAALSSAAGSTGASGTAVSAGLARAASVGSLSVPQSWGSAAPEIRLASTARALSAAGPAALPDAASTAPGGWFGGGIPPVGSVVNAPRNGEQTARYKARAKVIAQLPGEHDAHDHAAEQMPPPARRASDVASKLSARERDELDQLRSELAELVMERDAAARLIKEAIRP